MVQTLQSTQLNNMTDKDSNLSGGLFDCISTDLHEDLLASFNRQPYTHFCAKCGTGYAGPECVKKSEAMLMTETALEERLKTDPDFVKKIQEAGSIQKVGPNVRLARAPISNREYLIKMLLSDVIGENADREGLAETPARVIKAWNHWTSGYNANIAGLLKVFEDGAEGYDEMVVRKNIRIYSHCEHHLAPIIGDCTIAYIPNGRVVGLSKLDRLADVFARRLQVQERLTTQIADALWEHLQPKGVGVHINARHMCVESRGVSQQDSSTITCALRGAMKDQPETRAEFMALVK